MKFILWENFPGRIRGEYLDIVNYDNQQELLNVLKNL